MIRWTGATPVARLAYAGSDQPTKRDGELAARQERSRWILSLPGNILIALFYALFLYSATTFWIQTGSILSAGLIFFNTLLVVSLLTRRPPTAVTRSLRNWILAPLTQVVPLLLRPGASASWSLVVAGSAGQVMGLAIMIASLMALNRSIGIVAANRGIKTRGVYAWVRHPLYAGEILFFASFLISNWSSTNAVLVSLLILAQVIRSYQEEALLVGDERYAPYRIAVAYRLIPGLF